MKIGIVAPSPAPFVPGGAESFWRGLYTAFHERTPHDVDLIKLPVREFTLPGLVRSYRAFAELDLSHLDMVVSSKYPAWMVDHPNHVVYMQHKLRGLYDTYDRVGTPRIVVNAGTELDTLLGVIRRPGTAPADIFGMFERTLERCGADHPAFGFPSPLAREMIHALDGWALDPRRIRKYMALSRAVTRRDEYFPPGVPVEVLPHPPEVAGYHSRRYEYFFTAGRLDAPKRIGLIVEAMRYVDEPVRLLIAGAGPERERLEELARNDSRVTLCGWVSEADKLALYADALAVPHVPLDEDMGLITQEAMRSGKAVITTTDSGGATELVVDGITGIICAPTPESIGASLNGLARDAGRARRMGERGRTAAAAITWDRLTTAMTRGAEPKARLAEPAWTGRQRVVVVSNYAVHSLLHGGALRCRHLYRGLLDRFDVQIISLGSRYADAQSVEIEPGMFETVIPLTESFIERERELWPDAGMSIFDVTSSALHLEVPLFTRELRTTLRHASAVILAHPYLLSAVRGLDATIPMVYDAHNAEFAMKRDLLPDNESGRRLAGLVQYAEGRAVRESARTVVCSSDDEQSLRGAFDAGSSRFVLIPNGVNADEVPFVSGTRRERARHQWLQRFQRLGGSATREHMAVFIGSAHPPNLEATEQIFGLAQRLPGVLFVIAGSMSTHFPGWHLPENVTLLGRTSEAAKHLLLRAASVALNPMIHGGGSNLKIIEYMAAGVPVVTTPAGARSLLDVTGDHFVVAPPEAFAGAIESVLRDAEGSAHRAARARRLVEERYHWPVLGATLSTTMAALVREPARVAG